MVKALTRTFGQLGLSLDYSGSSTGITPPDTNTSAEINSEFAQFVGQIFQTRSNPQGAGSPLASENVAANQVSGPSTASYLKPLAQELDSLAQAVGAGNSLSGNATRNGNGGAESPISSNMAISILEQEFSNLFGATAAGNGTSLQTFLHTVASNVAQESASGASAVFVQTAV